VRFFHRASRGKPKKKEAMGTAVVRREVKTLTLGRKKMGRIRYSRTTSCVLSLEKGSGVFQKKRKVGAGKGGERKRQYVSKERLSPLGLQWKRRGKNGGGEWKSVYFTTKGEKKVENSRVRGGWGVRKS